VSVPKPLEGEGGPPVSVDTVMAELQGRVRERLRANLLDRGASRAFEDPAVFAEVEALFQRAVNTTDTSTLILPELLGDPATWRLSIGAPYRSHRSTGAASIILLVKRRIMMPILRWLFEYSRDNFERQRRVNDVLFACVQELAAETTRLRQEVSRLSTK
jgi:hypothetical protein